VKDLYNRRLASSWTESRILHLTAEDESVKTCSAIIAVVTLKRDLRDWQGKTRGVDLSALSECPCLTVAHIGADRLSIKHWKAEKFPGVQNSLFIKVIPTLDIPTTPTDDAANWCRGSNM